MSVKAAQQRGCAKRAFCGVCFLVAGGLKPGALVFVSGCGDFDLGFGNVSFGAAAGVRGSGCAGFARLRGSGSTFGSGGGTGRGVGRSWSFGTAGGGLVGSVTIADVLTKLCTINGRCCRFFLRLFNDGLFDFDDSGIGNGGNYNVGLLLRNLALKYSINMHIVNETVGVNKAGQDYKLSDYLQVKTLSQKQAWLETFLFALDRCSIGCYNAKSKKSYTNPTERSNHMGRNDRYYMSSVKIGPKGQIVIPKEARDMFGLEPGDTLVLMADKKKGLALQTVDKLNPLMKTVFNSLPSEDGEVDDE